MVLSTKELHAEFGSWDPALLLPRSFFVDPMRYQTINSWRSIPYYDRGTQTNRRQQGTSTEDDIQKQESETDREDTTSMHSENAQVNNKEQVPPTVLPLSNPEKHVVGWDSQDDPTMPLNFSASRKYWIVAGISFVSLMTPLSSSILAPAIKYYTQEFGETDLTLGSMPVSIFLLGFAVGPLFLSPMSEMYGRAIVITGSNMFFCLWHIGCALAPNLASLIVFRFLAGVGGSASMTLGGALMADLFPVEKRGFALGLWSIGPTIGPSLGPLIGAFIAGSIGWRWTAWVVFIPTTVCTFLLAAYLPETNHKVLIQRKLRALQKKFNQPEITSCYDTEESRKQSNCAFLLQNLVRPLKFLFLCPIVAILSIYVSFVYATIYLMYNILTIVFQVQYGWSTSLAGLVYLSIGVGYFLGLTSFSFISDRLVIRLTKQNGGKFEPEMRLPGMVYYSFIVPITFFWYGWTAQYKVHWIVPVLGLMPLGIGIFGLWMPAQAYIIDAYPEYAASGLAAFTVVRCLIAAFLPMAGPAMFDNLGLGWGNSVLGFICIGMIPIPILIERFGRRIRTRSALKL